MTLVGQTLGEFEILEALGQGGMGAVYKARQLSLRRLVALKTLQPAMADDEAYIARFQQEAIAAAGLNHPNLVQVYSAGQSEGLHWFSMEYVEGESARTRLKRERRIDPPEAITIAICVATALQYGWRKASLIHRDIKPDNIFLARSGEVKLGDLGLAKSAAEDKGLTSTGHSLGTLYYISPEQARDSKTVDFRADIYSLGCTLFEMVSGRPPFDGSNAAAILLQHMTEPVPSLQAKWPQCPARLSDLVGKMMQKDPGDRPQDYATLISELRHAYAMPASPAVPVRPGPPAEPAPAPVRAAPLPVQAEPDIQSGPRDGHRATYVIDLDLDASTGPAPASALPSADPASVQAAPADIPSGPDVPLVLTDDGSVTSVIEAQHAASPPPVQPGAKFECETLPANRREPPRVPATEADPPSPTRPGTDVLSESPTTPTLPLPSGPPSSTPQSQPAGSGELRLAPPIEIRRASLRSADPLSSPSAVPGRKPPGSDPPRKSFPFGKIAAALLLFAAAWFYWTHYGRPQISVLDTDEPADAPNPDSVWRDWVLEGHRDGYFLYHREMADRTVGNHTEVVFEKRASANSQETFRNGKIRVRCVIPPPTLPTQYVQFYVRMAPDAKGVFRRYETYLTHETVVFALNDSAQGVHEITHWPVPPTPDLPIDIVMEIEAKKNTFTVSLNRMVLGTVRDDTLPGAGTFGVDGPAETRLNTLSFINLDPPALPALPPATQ